MGSKGVEGLVCCSLGGSGSGSGSGCGVAKMRRWVVRLAMAGLWGFG